MKKMERIVSSLSQYERESPSTIFFSKREDHHHHHQVDVVIDGQISTQDLEAGLKRAHERTGKRVNSKRLVKWIDRVRSSNIVECSEIEIRKILEGEDVKYRIPSQKTCCTMYVTTTRSLDVTIDVDLCVQLVQDRIRSNRKSDKDTTVKQEKSGSVNVSIKIEQENDEDNVDIFGTIWTRLTFSTTLLTSEDNDDKNSWKLSISVTSHHNRTTSKMSLDSIEIGKSTIRRRRRDVSGENDDLEPLLYKRDGDDDDDDGEEVQRKTRALQMYRKENLAIPVIYFMLGMTLKLPLVALREYMRKVRGVRA